MVNNNSNNNNLGNYNSLGCNNKNKTDFQYQNYYQIISAIAKNKQKDNLSNQVKINLINYCRKNIAKKIYFVLKKLILKNIKQKQK